MLETTFFLFVIIILFFIGLIWRNQKKVVLSNLDMQAIVYLAIPASSVPSERLFSSAGNVFTKKRNRPSKNSIHNILFLKENSKLFE